MGPTDVLYVTLQVSGIMRCNTFWVLPSHSVSLLRLQRARTSVNLDPHSHHIRKVQTQTELNGIG